MSAVVTSSAMNIKQSEEKIQEFSSKAKIFSKKVTLYRHGLDGSITPVTVKLNLGETKDIGDAIIEKCQELFEKDFQFKNLENISKIKFGLYNIISSKGRGFHYQMKLLGKLSIRYILFRLGLPRLNTIFNDPIIICRYKKDKNAKTTINPIIPGLKTKVVNGSHTVIVHDFIGFTSWRGRFSFTPLNLIPKSFFGVAKFSFCF
jgi:hypothetical protein